MGILGRLGRSRDDVEALELRAEHEEGCIRIEDARPGEVVTIKGTVRAVTQRPREAIPAVSIELFDGTGAATVTWMGRRRIGGIVTGRRLVVTGRLTRVDGGLSMFNPRYVLKP